MSCKEFNLCGGCAYQNISYEEEFLIKQKKVSEIFKDILLIDDFYKSPSIEGYRNKMELSFGDDGRDGNLLLGMRKRRSFYEVCDVSDCNIMPEAFRIIAQVVLDFFRKSGSSFYHKKRHEGCCRHLVLRRGEFMHEILVNIVTSSAHPPLKPLAETLAALDLNGETIVGIMHTVNDGLSDTVKCDSLEILHGRDHFFEELLGLRFKVSPFSFFQTNSSGAQELYRLSMELLGNCDGKVVYDLYCGTGTIALVMAKNTNATHLYGIEIIDEAVEAAKENALLNGLGNVSFYTGDVQTAIDTISPLANPDTIILDPPREGLHPKMFKKIEALLASKLLYISCKPTSLSRDLPLLKNIGYTPQRSFCLDMFPRTEHLETVVLMSRVESF